MPQQGGLTMNHKTIAIIAEYNPFHTGHAWQIAQIKKRYQPEAVLVLMSGNYVQRGTPAITCMHARARMAMECNLPRPCYNNLVPEGSYKASSATNRLQMKG